MKVEQIYTGCLSHAAYYIENNGEAAIFDPLREVQPYIDRANADNAKIKYVFETHFHADFISGHLDLRKKTGADIVFGPTAKPDYEAIIATDGQEFKVGNYTLKLLHTPGHTMESFCVLLIDENGKEYGLISGDTLFIGDVGRPDLAQHVISDLTEEKLAGHLYDSLRNKVMPLSDDLIVFPNHGAGSACGKNMSTETTDTLGNQKRTNYALNPDLTKEEFIKEILTGLMPPPGYFPSNVLMNIRGSESFDDVKERSMKAYTVGEFDFVANESRPVVLDVRDADEFAKGFIPNSINIGVDGNFAQWTGEMIVGIETEILLVAPEDRIEETITRLSRVGYDHVLGYLKGGFEAWKESGKDFETFDRITSKEFEDEFNSNPPVVIDVRKESEFQSQHVKDAINIPLNSINEHLASIPKDKRFVVYCKGGYRSMIAASILKQRGFNDFADVIGGFEEIEKENVETTDYICPTTML